MTLESASKANPLMALMALESVVQILHEDLAKFHASGSEYHANAARQWARDAAHRARIIFPELREEA